MIRVAAEIEAAVRAGRPVVALETSIVAQGLPHPHNLEAALRCERAVREEGALPATIAVLGGEVRVGLGRAAIERLADRGRPVAKLSARDLGRAAALGLDGATTVAGTCRVAAAAGLRFFATGGIGGVHRRRPGHPLDESADLAELARSAVAVFCAGAKTILDVPATLERLESLSVPVLGYGTDDFPGFYMASTGRRIPRLDGADEVARCLRASWDLGSAGAVVAVPPPMELEGAEAMAERALEETQEAEGADATPAALARIAELSGGRSVEVNLALVENNARIAARCAVAYSTPGRSA
ncbi:MAG TPA: pseudouridine-5'-phosphate glycosidase [Candidatus Dormibacteraeota bacterium]|nr:pseudouridine-5'-phosphate glycosidase [Candidatus Dormibacteraeota bacterium]